MSAPASIAASTELCVESPQIFTRSDIFSFDRETLAGGPPAPGTSITFVTPDRAAPDYGALGVAKGPELSFLRRSDKATLMDSIGRRALIFAKLSEKGRDSRNFALEEIGRANHERHRHDTGLGHAESAR